MAQIKILKDEFFEEIKKNHELKERIREVLFIQNNSVRALARDKSEKLTQFGVMCIVRDFLKKKTIEEMFITRAKR